MLKLAAQGDGGITVEMFKKLLDVAPSGVV